MKLVRTALKDAGYRVEVALDSETVMASLEPHRYDLAILDSGLAAMGGLPIAERLRLEPEGRGLYVIEILEEGEKLPVGAPVGPDDILSKPFDADGLLTAVQVGLRLVGLQRELDFANHRIETLAMTDALTGLPNRQALVDMLGTDIARQTRESAASCLGLIDVAHMHEINMLHGRTAGDLAIMRVARTLRSSAREADVIGRLDEDKFVIVLYDCDPESSGVACQRLCEAIEYEPLRLIDRDVRLSINCGVVALDPDFGPVETIEAARAALHAAKKRGVTYVALESKYPDSSF
ncbi:MAG: GGDEF domain-containing response regulator [Gaiellaceae bacterium]